MTPSPSAARIRIRNSSSGMPMARAWAARSSCRARLRVRSAARIPISVEPGSAHNAFLALMRGVSPVDGAVLRAMGARSNRSGVGFDVLGAQERERVVRRRPRERLGRRCWRRTSGRSIRRWRTWSGRRALPGCFNHGLSRLGLSRLGVSGASASCGQQHATTHLHLICVTFVKWACVIGPLSETVADGGVVVQEGGTPDGVLGVANLICGDFVYSRARVALPACACLGTSVTPGGCCS